MFSIEGTAYPYHMFNLNKVFPYSVFILNTPHTYPFHVSTFSTQSILTMYSLCTHSLSIPCVPIEHAAYPHHVFNLNTVIPIPCVHLKHTAYRFHVSILNTQSVLTRYSLWTLIHNMCPSWEHGLAIQCVPPAYTIYLYLVLTLNTQVIHTMCSLWTHSLYIPCVQLKTHTMCSSWEHSLAIQCVSPAHTIYLYHAFN